MSVGTGFYAFNAFMEPICRLRGWTRTDLNMALAIGTIFGFLGQFIYGTIVLRAGVRPLMMIGSIIGGLAFMIMARVDQLWQFYLFYTLLFIGNGAYGGIVSATAVNNWFVTQRGRALGFSTAGISFSGAVLPLLAMFFILRGGVENAAIYLGISVLSVSPLAGWIIREWPEDIGLLPDGVESAHEPNPASSIHSAPTARRAAPKNPWTLTDLLRSAVFWKLGLSFAMLMMGTVGVMSQLKPRFADLGFNDMHAMILMAGTALIGSLGKYLWGVFCDRFSPIKVAMLLALANACGLTLALCHTHPAALFLFIGVFGFTMGGILSAYPIMVGYLFGRDHFVGVLRYISVFLILQLCGYVIAGQSYDRTGSYDTAYMLFIALDIAAAVLLATLKRPEPTK